MPDLFSIECTTCKSRLKVRDAGVIGQILGCPKCGSMVEVAPPPGWNLNPTPAGIASSTPGGSGVLGPTAPTAPLPKPANAPAPIPAPQPRPIPTGPVDPASLKETRQDGEFGDVDVLLGDKPKPTPPIHQGPIHQGPKSEIKKKTPSPKPAPPAELAAAESPPRATPAPASASHVSPQVKRMRLVGMLVAGGFVGVALAMGVAYMVISWTAKPTEIAEVPTTPVPPTPEPEVTEKPDVPPPAEEKPVEPMPVEKPAVEEVAVVEPKPVEPKPMPMKDPLGLVEDPPVKPMSDDPSGLLNDLNKIGNLIPGDSGDPSPDPPEGSSSEAVPPTEPAPESRPRPEIKKIDIAAALDYKLLSVKFTDTPLAEVLRDISNLSQIPITLEPEALAWARITPRQPVSVDLTDATVRSLLTETLRPLMLEPSIVGDQILVTRTAALRKIRYPVGDLTKGSDAERARLLEWVAALAAPGSWKAAGGPGTITVNGDDFMIENQELAHGQVVELFERLRVARGGTPRSTFPPEWFARERRTTRAAKKLDLPLTLNYSQPTQLTKILERLERDAKINLVVDWRALAAAGWPTDCDATVTLTKTPLREGLTNLLTPMDLTYRVVSPDMLQITSPQAVAQHPELEVHDAAALTADSPDGIQLLDRIRESLGEKTFREAGGVGAIRFDAPSKSLIALLPQPQQEALAAMLVEWQTN